MRFRHAHHTRDSDPGESGHIHFGLPRCLETLRSFLPGLDKQHTQKTADLLHNTELTNGLAAERTSLATERTDLVRKQTQLSTRSTELSVIRTDMSRERSGLAGQRTDMAVLRTDLALIRTGLAFLSIAIAFFRMFGISRWSLFDGVLALGSLVMTVYGISGYLHATKKVKNLQKTLADQREAVT